MHSKQGLPLMEWCFQFMLVKLDESKPQHVIILRLFQEESGIVPP